MSNENRPLSEHERRLVRWMLEHGKPEAAAFLAHLDEAEVTPYKCKCGCATIEFQIRGHPTPHQISHPVIADFIFSEGKSLSGIFVYAGKGILQYLEVYGLAGDAPKTLPQPEDLVSWNDSPPTNLLMR